MDGSNQIRDIRGNIVRISIIKTGANTISTEASSHEYECAYLSHKNVFIFLNLGLNAWKKNDC